MSKDFIWGKIVHVHAIGEHEIVEFNPYVVRDCAMTRETEDKILFGIITSRSSSRHYGTLDAALLGSLVAKFDGPDSQADRLIAKMLGVPLDGESA